MQGLRQFNNDADAFFDAFFNGTQQGRYVVTSDGRIIDMRDMPRMGDNVVRYTGDGGGGNPVRVSANDANSPIITVIKITG